MLLKFSVMFLFFQHLFMTFPRIVFMLVAFTLLVPMVGTFTLYHVFLISANQTTNERYKRVSDTDFNPVESVILSKAKHRKTTITRTDKSPLRAEFCYSRGLLANLYEVFSPKTFLSSKSKQK